MVLLLDIEGTTTPIDFVHKTLFPFARARVGSFLAENFSLLGGEILALEDEAAGDIVAGGYKGVFDPADAESVADYVHYLIDRDRKSTPLKSIQGMIWKEGYETGKLISDVYPDVRPAFERWRTEGRKVYIFSSGSVLAQKLLFAHTSEGDLTQYISGYFDTNTGNKRDIPTYNAIAENIGSDAGSILFVSDVDAELDAASKTEMQTRLSVRQGNPPQANLAGHAEITELTQIL